VSHRPTIQSHTLLLESHRPRIAQRTKLSSDSLRMNSTTKSGLEFHDLARGGERNYCCSYLVSLDCDLLSLACPDRSFLSMAGDVLAGHCTRILDQLSSRSGRDIDQFCLGSTYLQLNPNYRRLERMDPLTWKKEGISAHWSGSRGFRKSCCKVCCVDKLCSGCKNCLCNAGPIRGAYDGMVVLTCVTKECVPRSIQAKLDHEELSIALEFGLTMHYIQMGGDLGTRVVHTGRERFLSELSPKLGKPKKHAAYCVYMAYRLEKGGPGGEDESEMTCVTPRSLDWEVEEEEDEETQQVIEELEDKQLLGRLAMVEHENKELREVVARLEHGRGWLEQRVGVLESQISPDTPLPHFADKINTVVKEGEGGEKIA